MPAIIWFWVKFSLTWGDLAFLIGRSAYNDQHLFVSVLFAFVSPAFLKNCFAEYRKFLTAFFLMEFTVPNKKSAIRILQYDELLLLMLSRFSLRFIMKHFAVKFILLGVCWISSMCKVFHQIQDVSRYYFFKQCLSLFRQLLKKACNQLGSIWVV